MFVKGGSKTTNINIRIVDNTIDKKILNKINEVKNKLPSWANKKANLGYAETNIEGINKTEYFAHSSIQTEIPSVKGSGISLKPEESPFTALKVNGSNVVNGENAWLRDIDSEYKILSDIQKQLGDKNMTSGSLKLYTELPPCPSCQDVIRQFNQMYPQIDIEVIYSIEK